MQQQLSVTDIYSISTYHLEFQFSVYSWTTLSHVSAFYISLKIKYVENTRILVFVKVQLISEGWKLVYEIYIKTKKKRKKMYCLTRPLSDCR